MFSTKETANRELTTYANGADFCRIFTEEMDRLYLLALLLTANPVLAEKCFVRGLDESARSNRIFKEWARSWARRMVIQNAIRTVQPRATSDRASNEKATHQRNGPAEIVLVSQLPTFERFVFVISVLEGYSDRDCSLLLDCRRHEVIAARTRALQRMGSLELEHRATRTKQHAGETHPAPARRPEISQLAASA